MDAIIAQVQDLASKADEKGRIAIQLALRDLQTSLETPRDTAIRLYNLHLQVAAVRIGVDLGLFRTLAKSDGSVTVNELAERSGAAPELLGKVLRYLASVGFIKENGQDQFGANKITHILADPNMEGGAYHAFDVCSPAIQAFPDFLAEIGYQNITSNTKTPFQKAFNTDQLCFAWLAQQPKRFADLQKAMTALQSIDWASELQVLETEALAVPSQPPETSERPFLVDVGGGYGHQCVQLREKYPNLRGRLVLQDLPETVNKLQPIDGVKIMVQDFFEKQAIEGAKFYYLRRVMHDWPDTECVKILQNLELVLASDSRILLDEIVLPDSEVYWQAMVADLAMMILFAGKERTRKEWHALVEQTGLRITHIHTYDASLYHSVIVLERK